MTQIEWQLTKIEKKWEIERNKIMAWIENKQKNSQLQLLSHKVMYHEYVDSNYLTFYPSFEFVPYQVSIYHFINSNNTLGCNQVKMTCCCSWLILHLNKPKSIPRIRKGSIYPSSIKPTTLHSSGLTDNKQQSQRTIKHDLLWVDGKPTSHTSTRIHTNSSNDSKATFSSTISIFPWKLIYLSSHSSYHIHHSS